MSFDLREGEAPLLESLEKFRGGVHRTSLFKMEEQNYERKHENEKSAPRQSLCIILMHRAAHRNNFRLVHRHCKHGREQDPGRKSEGRITVQP